MPDAASVFDVLPLGLAAGVSVHVGTADPMGDAAPVQVLAGPSGQPFKLSPPIRQKPA